MIIIEGMDNSGKSTLVKNICELIPQLKLIGSDGPKDRDAMLVRCVNGMIDPYSIYDRYHAISEWVYGPVLRGENKFGLLWPELLYQTILQAPAIIYCRPEDDVIVQFDSRQQMEGVKMNAEQLLSRYDRVMYLLKNLCETYGLGAVIRYDYREMELDPVVDFLREYLKTRCEFNAKLTELALQQIEPYTIGEMK